MHLFLYGPPGSGKSTTGAALAAALSIPFCDIDALIESQAGMPISQIFSVEGESGFRERELKILREIAHQKSTVYALGGGALLNAQARELAEKAGRVLCLEADPETLLKRLRAEYGVRPLLANDPAEQLKRLLAERSEHYRSFALRLDTTHLTPEMTCWEAQVCLGIFHVSGMGEAYDAMIADGGLCQLGSSLRERNLNGPAALVSDRNVGSFYLERVENAMRAAGYTVSSFCIEPGETHKTIDTVQDVWNFLIQAGIERGSMVVALGGGVTGDLTGFAAATFLRGVPWVNVPTSLLAMVDSSLGGKTGVDLPQAKNLVGAFYSPRLVLADPQVLMTLPDRELRNGLAEAAKHGVIDDPELFALCARGWTAVSESLDWLVRRAMAVKVKVIQRDPYEKGQRKALNLGHTIGHGVEKASNFQLSHGEAVAIGMVAEARLSESIGLAERGLAEQITATLAGLGLPTRIPDNLSADQIMQAMLLDKKRSAGVVRFALPVRIGNIQPDVVVEDWQRILVNTILPKKGKA